ncbi:hypothetical protein RF11_07934 [Thelohanellus kitauei]|uniref:Uncharacterized protein n=1 Tax=Thelohanellus kitauei TaxID=669202 RepID=A0A0C2I9Y3_THEKT|nr:hypothetical protein RF11_07934 [Thelohanellus kitauei]
MIRLTVVSETPRGRDISAFDLPSMTQSIYVKVIESAAKSLVAVLQHLCQIVTSGIECFENADPRYAKLYAEFQSFHFIEVWLKFKLPIYESSTTSEDRRHVQTPDFISHKIGMSVLRANC